MLMMAFARHSLSRMGVTALMWCCVQAAAQSVSGVAAVYMGESLTIGGVRLPWASRFVLTAQQAETRRDNRCAFSFTYELQNTANTSLTVSATTVFADQQPLHLGQPLLLRSGDKKILSGRIYLGNGESALRFRVETAAGVSEKTAAVFVAGC